MFILWTWIGLPLDLKSRLKDIAYPFMATELVIEFTLVSVWLFL